MNTKGHLVDDESSFAFEWDRDGDEGNQINRSEFDSEDSENQDEEDEEEESDSDDGEDEEEESESNLMDKRTISQFSYQSVIPYPFILLVII